MHPIVQLTVDGQPVAGSFYERLVSLSIADKEGVSSDTFSAELHDGPPDFLALPRKGAVVVPSLGYRETGVRPMGRFTVDQVRAKCLPYGVSISGKAADLRRPELKQQRERHWDGRTVREIVEEIAGEAGLAPRVSDAVGGHVYEWLGQQDETNLHFLERLARRHNALFAIKEGNLIFAERGSGTALSGAALGTVLITPARAIEGSISFDYNDRTAYAKVVAYYQDRDTAERVEIEVEGDPEAEGGVFRIPEPFADPAEADRAAQSKAKQLKRGQGNASVEIPGDTSVVAGAPLIFAGIRPGLDGVPYVVETATHTISKSNGYRTKIDAKLYDGEESEGGAPADAPPNAPAAPRAWSSAGR